MILEILSESKTFKQTNPHSFFNSSYQMLMISFYEYDANNNKFSKYNYGNFFQNYYFGILQEYNHNLHIWFET